MRRGAATVVEVSGELDLCTAPWLAEELRRALRSSHPVVIDLEDVEFIDCAALGVLLSAANMTDSMPPRILVTQGPRQVQKLFELTGAGQVLQIVTREAVASLSDSWAALNVA